MKKLGCAFSCGAKRSLPTHLFSRENASFRCHNGIGFRVYQFRANHLSPNVHLSIANHLSSADSCDASPHVANRISRIRGKVHARTSLPRSCLGQ